MGLSTKIARYIRRHPYYAADEFSMPACLLVPAVMWNWFPNKTLIAILALGAVGMLVKTVCSACEKKWRVTLDSPRLVWDLRHWMLWCGRLVVSICLAGLFGLMLSIFIDQFKR